MTLANPVSAPAKNLLMESIRGLAALVVLVFHLRGNGFNDWLPAISKYGWIGVNVFFALSGFLIARSILIPEKFRFLTYGRARLRRIFPAYLASLILLIGIQNTRYLVTPGWEKDLLAHLFLAHAWFGDGIMASINGVYWTLSHEGTFYLLMGCAAPLVRNYRGAWPVVILLLVTTWVTRWFWLSGAWDLPNGHFHPLCYWEQFAFGVLAAALVSSEKQTTPSLNRKWAWALVLVGLMLVGWALVRYQKLMDTIPPQLLWGPDAPTAARKAFGPKPHTFLTSPTLISLGCGMILYVCWRCGTTAGAWLRFTPLPWMGKVSYSTYLWHLPVIMCLTALKRHSATASNADPWLNQPLAFFTTAFILVYLISWLSYEGFERPYFEKRARSGGG
jgi:peptidoglycan/LPS O-acetylase OafA/YrhL